ncbi:tRNA (adenosine(37)-N6)-dimethylallyltransferase MiaA [Companilactobacillus furfuricola]|uniref:tRNA (adenosine(37)-N6)-dimethylallyltransferase MiaA n=1 Tax=Companilactobacillus furfuricola TaxID=1462575 RepID=UPI000F7B2C1B|nr:tRNA (adenosine(37)-N6)-dimethylallyltransferase MiaA [Companilactobacillus furfuricola]
MEKVIAIVGPTAVGKSALGMKLAKKFSGEIISGDSMQIYRGLDIGTAKDSPQELKEVEHHLVDICDVDQRYTVKDFQAGATKSIQEIAAKNKLPLIVGGTGFYLNSLLRNLELGGNSDVSTEIKKRVLKIEQEFGLSGLQKELTRIDPQASEKIDMSNPRRVMRAIEVFQDSGHSITEQQNGEAIADFCLIGLTDDRPVLYDRINCRVDKMVDQGLLAEAKSVFDRQDEIPQAKNGIGYKELFPYFDGQATLDSCLTEIKKNSRHFAKRQLTYFRNQMSVNWYNISQTENYVSLIEKKVAEFLQ